jgi:transposase, IS5 family
VLTLLAEQQECLWDEALPIEVKELPEDLAALGRLLDEPAVLAPIVERFRREVIEDKRAVLTDGRPTIAMETYVRLMVLKQRYRWGYRSLVAEGVPLQNSPSRRSRCARLLLLNVMNEGRAV